MDASLVFDIEKAQIQKFAAKKIDKERLIYLSSRIRGIIENRGIDTKKIRETLNGIINEEKIRESKIDFGIVTVSVSDLKPFELYKEDIPCGKMVDYLMASANLPVFKRESIEGKFYIDGCFYDKCPINLLIRKGYSEVIAIRTLAMGISRKIEDKNVKIINVVPSEDLGKVFDFDNNLIQSNLKMGYCDAMRVIKGLNGRKYYIAPISDDDLFFYSLLAVPEEVIYYVGEIMNLHKMQPKRMLFEKIIPTLSHMLGLPINATYQDIIIGILECIAEKRGIERYKIWDFISFLKEIKSIDVEKKSAFNSSIIKIKEQTKLSTVFFKKASLVEISEKFIAVIKIEQFA